MKKLTVALAVCAFLALGAGVTKADHYYRSNPYNSYRNDYRDRCDYDYRDYRGCRESYRYVPVYVEPHCAPRYAAPGYGYPSYGYPNVGIGFSTKNFSFYYGR